LDQVPLGAFVDDAKNKDLIRYGIVPDCPVVAVDTCPLRNNTLFERDNEVLFSYYTKTITLSKKGSDH
jgi:hypothetical protein